MKVMNATRSLAAISIVVFLGLACGITGSGPSSPGGQGNAVGGVGSSSGVSDVGSSGYPAPKRDSKTIVGKVVGVTDGDTVVIFNSSERVRTKVRLATIDCPEKTQDFGVRAKDSLSSLVFGKDVEVEVRDIDRYGRTVGVVRIGGVDVNLEQIKRGFAWHYTQYSREQPAEERFAYAEAERKAREGRVGLWADSDPTPPWNYRRSKRNQSSITE